MNVVITVSPEFVRALSQLREAQDFLVKAKADPRGLECGTVRDGREWVDKQVAAVLSHLPVLPKERE